MSIEIVKIFIIRLDFIFHSLQLLTNNLEIETSLIKSSEIFGDDTTLKSKNRVINLCKQLSADECINPMSGAELYDKQVFKKEELILIFHSINKIEYTQFSHTPVPYLSILDAMMFTHAESLLNDYQLL